MVGYRDVVGNWGLGGRGVWGQEHERGENGPSSTKVLSVWISTRFGNLTCFRPKRTMKSIGLESIQPSRQLRDGKRDSRTLRPDLDEAVHPADIVLLHELDLHRQGEGSVRALMTRERRRRGK